MYRSQRIGLGFLAMFLWTWASFADEGRREDFAPSIAPDGSKLAYYSYRGDQLPEIFVLDLETGNERQLTFNEDRWDLGVIWSPDGERLFFSSGVEGADTMAIYSLRPDGSEVRQETQPPSGSRHAEVSFSSDGKRMAYARFEARGRSAFVLRNRVTGVETDVLTTSDPDEQNLKPRLHPNGGLLLFVSNRDGQGKAFDLYTLNLGTRKIRQVTDTDANERMPTWSADGTEILFSSNPSGRSYDLYVISAQGDGEAERLTYFEDRQELNSASVGDKLYFDAGHYGSQDGGDTYLYELDRSTRHVMQITGIPNAPKAGATASSGHLQKRP